jgi:hypothetical protein
MTEFVSKFRTLSKEELAPHVSPQSKTNTSLHVVAFDNLHIHHDADVFTLPGGELLHADRNPVVSPEQDARNIARIHGKLIVSADRSLALPDNPRIDTQGYSVRLSTGLSRHSYADLRNLDPETPHDHSLELHRYSDLVEYLKDKPEREVDEYYLRTFGRLAIRIQ